MWKKKPKEYTYVVLFSNTLLHIKYFLYHYLVENVQIHTQAHKQDKASASKQEVSDDTTAVIATYKHTAHFLLLHFVPVMSSKVWSNKHSETHVSICTVNFQQLTCFIYFLIYYYFNISLVKIKLALYKKVEILTKRTKKFKNPKKET